ncbi:MAG: hypothetical protein CMK23_07155 [Porticoccaceae bacterium]|nr:hypothetical protein [Porticoccaceae bacterium]
MVNFRTNKQKRRNAELVHGLIPGESNRNRRSHIGRRLVKQVLFTREQGEQAIVNSLKDVLGFNAGQARVIMEYAKTFDNPRVLLAAIAHVVYRMLPDIPIFGNFRRNLNLPNLGTWTRSWKIFFGRIDSTWANTLAPTTRRADFWRLIFQRKPYLVNLSFAGLFVAFYMHRLVDIFAREYNQRGDGRWDRIHGQVRNLGIEFWGVLQKLIKILKLLWKAIKQIPNMRGATIYASEKAFNMLLRKAIESFAGHVSGAYATNGYPGDGDMINGATQLFLTNR